jgi:hypothetical protein
MRITGGGPSRRSAIATHRGGLDHILGIPQRRRRVAGGMHWDVCGCESSTFCIQSVEITLHLAPMVKTLLRRLRLWPAVEAVFARVADRFRTWPSADFDYVSTSMVGSALGGPPAIRPAAPISIAPETFEMRFMKLQAEGRFDEMWEMVAEDAQRAWGGREAFVRGMPRLGDDTELLDMQPISVNVLEGWTDRIHQRTYHNVAQMVMRYRVKQHWREWTFDRQVHLIPAADGWRTLCYPARSQASSSPGTR